MSDALLHGLNDAQRRAAAHVRGPILVLAGAGSGKTRVLTTRIANLIQAEGVRPDRIFAVTFTNKAAGEMKERIGTLLDRDPTGLWIGTFHSLSARLLRREAERIGFTRGFTIYDQDDSTSLIKRLLDERNHPAKIFPPRVVQGIISGAKNRMQTAQDLERSAPGDPTIRVAADVYVAYQQALRTANAMDFDDLLLHPLALFRDHPDVLARWQQRFDFLLVDEFQDTNGAQYALIRALAGTHRNLFAVGDDDQSIYGWRGADVGNMRSLQTDFPGTEMIRLEENYRSTKPILDAANAVIARNSGRLGKTLRTSRPGGDSLVVLGAADERDESEWIAAELARRERTGVGYRGMAVLYRTNAQSRALEEALRRGGVPYRIIGAISFFDRREVKDLLAYLRLVANPSDDQAFLRAIAVPRRGIGPSAIAELTASARHWHLPLLATAEKGEMVTGLRPGVRTALLEFADLIRRSIDRAGESAPAIVMEELLAALDYEKALLAEGLEGADRWDNVRELVASAAEWSEVVTAAEDQEPGTPLQRWLAESALLSAADSSNGDAEGVMLMTLHTAKGLEWPVVVLSGMEDGLFPLGRALESTEGLEEERRLCYVGLTRARDALILTWARARRRGGEMRPGLPSRFLRELPTELIDEQRTSFGAGGITSGWSGSGNWSGSGGGQGGGSARWGSSREKRPPPPIAEVRQSFRSAPATPTPAPEQDNQAAPRYIKGERVSHRRFGSGAIMGLSGAGKDTKVTVAFDDPEVGTKQLLVAFAGLERDWESA
ncbi:MAG: UvrD-helicase domain-containing protein [Gemmatimonadota bacterium]